MEELRELLIQILNWWEEHQFDVYGEDYNVYDGDPDFVASAKLIWRKDFEHENPNNWSWLILP